MNPRRLNAVFLSQKTREVKVKKILLAGVMTFAATSTASATHPQEDWILFFGSKLNGRLQFTTNVKVPFQSSQACENAARRLIDVIGSVVGQTLFWTCVPDRLTGRETP